MKLLEADAFVPDLWVFVTDDAPVPDQPAIVTPDALEGALAAARDQPLGCVLQPDQDPAILLPYLDALALVCVRFPIFRDGRAFTQGRALREYHGYSGTIRAEGHILPDQYVFLRRCGIDSVALADDADEAPWLAARERFDIAYQHGLGDGSMIGSSLKRHIAPAETCADDAG